MVGAGLISNHPAFGRFTVAESVALGSGFKDTGNGGSEMKPIDARRLTSAKKQQVLERDNETCMYCLEVADEVDHIIPWSYRHDDSMENLVAACWLCNHIASNKVYDSFAEKRDAIIKRKNKILKNTIISVWTDPEVKEMGPRMRQDIRNNCIVVENPADARSVAARIKKAGLEVVIGDWRKQVARV